jgi:hypothetical protein
VLKGPVAAVRITKSTAVRTNKYAIGMAFMPPVFSTDRP